MIIFGVDPGTVKCGWGEIAVEGRKLVHVASGVIKRPAGWSMHRRLGGIQAELEERIAHRAAPQALSGVEVQMLLAGKPIRSNSMLVACEDVFVGRNLKTALAVGSARGIVMAAAGKLGLPLELLPTSTVKQAVAGKGNATKDEVQRAVRAILGVGELLEDQSDALAVAICAAMKWRQNANR